MHQSPSSPKSHGLGRPHVVGGLRRLLYIALGTFFVVLAGIGVVTPVLPTTPFLLLASYFYVRSSPTLHARLLRSRLFGGLLRDWQRHRGVRPRVKATATLVIILAIALSIWLAGLTFPLLLAPLGLAGIGLVVVLRLPVIREEPAPVLEPVSVRSEENAPA